MSKIYLIYGEENYFINQYTNDLINKYNSYEKIDFDMLESNISTALEDALMPSLFSSSKLLICNNCYFLTGVKCDIDHNIDDLIKYINIDSDNILLLIVNYGALDKRKKIVKELEKNAEIKVFNKLKDYELNKFVVDYCSNNGYSIDNSSINLLLTKLTNDLYIITSEINKLFIYKDDCKQISKSDIELVVSKVINSNIFDLIDAITKKDIDLSLSLYDDLLLINEEEIKLIVILANQFRLIYQVKEMYNSGYPELDIASSLDVHPYRVKLAKNINISPKEAINYLRKLAELDEQIKTGVLDKKQGFEKFILNI